MSSASLFRGRRVDHPAHESCAEPELGDNDGEERANSGGAPLEPASGHSAPFAGFTGSQPVWLDKEAAGKRFRGHSKRAADSGARLVREELPSSMTAAEVALLFRDDRRPFALIGRWGRRHHRLGAAMVAGADDDPFSSFPSFPSSKTGSTAPSEEGGSDTSATSSEEESKTSPATSPPISATGVQFATTTTCCITENGGAWWFEAFLGPLKEQRLFVAGSSCSALGWPRLLNQERTTGSKASLRSSRLRHRRPAPGGVHASSSDFMLCSSSGKSAIDSMTWSGAVSARCKDSDRNLPVLTRTPVNPVA